MNKIDDFEYGQFVIYDGKVMLVYGVPYEEEDEGYPDHIQLIEENSPRVYDKEEEAEYTKCILAPASDVLKPSGVNVSEDTLRSFFRIDTTPWNLCAEGLYPIAKESGSFALTEDDVDTFLSHLGSIDPVIYDEWQTQFVFNHHVRTQKEDPDHFTLKMVWNLMKDDFEWYDAEEDDPEYIQAIWEFYKLNKGKVLDEIDFPDMYKNTVISVIYSFSKDNPISDMQKQTYIKLLDEQVAADDLWAIRHKAYAYYGGNSIVPCDWKIAEETLLKLHDTQTEDAKYAANSLGYIYYSDRLGEPDYDKAFRYFSEAAEYGIIEAMYKQADMYRKGHGTKKRTRKALSTYKKLYKNELEKFKNNDTGCKLADVALRIGYCYENGEGVKKDLYKALEYFRSARNAIDARIAEHKHFGDETVKRNIDNSILRISDKLENSLPGIINENDFNGINLTGRMVYLFMCVEKFLVTIYPEKDWTLVAEKMWPWTEDYWDKGWDRYSVVVPEFLLEYPSYEETSAFSYEGDITKEDYNTLIMLYSDITSGDGKQDIDIILMAPIVFGNECEGTSASEALKSTMPIFNTVAEVFRKNHLRLPDIQLVKDFSIEEAGAWGESKDTRNYSIILA